MQNDGKRLEALVAFVEKQLLPQGFELKTNTRVYGDNGTQIAEFDVEARGRLGSTDIAWLIQCRDRPSSGPASGEWIEQLVGRRERFGFNKVTAVSTTGFSKGAKEFAQSKGIELREVKFLEPAYFDWLLLRHLNFRQNMIRLTEAQISVDENTDKALIKAALEVLKDTKTNEPIMRSMSTGKLSSLNDAFSAVTTQNKLFEGLDVSDPAKPVKIRAQYTNDNNFYVIETLVGPMRVKEIYFAGELSVRETLIPFSATAEYRHFDSGEAISQLAAFKIPTPEGNLSFELHHLSKTGEIHIATQNLSASPPADQNARLK